jgi:hypothetical protein
MATNRITFGEWLPDQPGLVGALTVAKNVYPKAVGYGPFPDSVAYSESASEELNNIGAAIDSAGSTKIFAGGSTRLFLFDSTDATLDDVSATTTGYTQSDRWRFVQFGENMIAANGVNKLQTYDLTTTAGTFVELDSNAPAAKLLTVVRDFVVTANVPGSYPNRVQWSGINDPTTWSSSGVTQSDFQDIPEGGEVRGLTGGEFGLLLLEKSIVRMSYVGTPLVFQFDTIARNIGCYETNSVVQWQGVTYFLSDDGFYACNGQAIEPIGAEKVNRFFFGDVVEANIGLMSAAIDPERNLVIWGYPSEFDVYRLLVYHIITKRWSIIDTNIDRVATSATPTATLEAIDVYNNNLDALGISLDSRVWVGGKILLAGVRDDKIVIFSGNNKTAQIETSDLENQGQSSMLTMVKPLVDGGSADVSVAVRSVLSDPITYGTPVSANAENRAGFRSYGKYHRIRTTPTGTLWTTAVGMDVELQPAGNR